MDLRGRDAELAAIDALVAEARDGKGGSLLLVAEAGAGKSALLTTVTDRVRAAGGVTVLSAVGIESEAPLAFAALQRLLAPLRAHVDAIPPPQARALRVAFGEEAGEAADRFLVFLAVVSLLSEAGAREPVLAVVDDAQWLDDASAGALQFVARRIGLEPVALLWAARDGHPRTPVVDDLPSLRPAGLGLEDAAALLSDRTGTRVSAEVAALIVANTGGNPLALAELPSVLSAAQLAGEEPLPPRLPVTERLERVFLDRARALSEHAQTLLLVVSADDSGRPGVVLQAAQGLGADPEALTELERSGLVQVSGDRLALRHPPGALGHLLLGSQRRAASRPRRAGVGADP